MLPVERRKEITQMLLTNKKVLVSELVGHFNVSDETIRRDLDQIAQDGIAEKIYGGATLNDKGPELPFKIRQSNNPTQKQHIANIISPLVKDGDSIILDASSTAVFVAKALKDKKRLKIITNALEVMLEVSDMPGWDVICTGGQLAGNYLALHGQRTMHDIAGICADVLIFSCKGLDIAHGVLESNDAFAQVKKEMIKAAKTKILAADYSKFDCYAFAKTENFCDIDILATNTMPEKRWVQHLKKNGVKVMV